MNKNFKIGLFGFGTVGESLLEVLSYNRAIDAEVVKICIKNANKKRSQSMRMFTTDYDEILNNKDINLILELIDDADEAYKIVKKALQKGKNVVSANKKMIAYHIAELQELSNKNKVSLLYDASACGSIPVIRNLEEYYDNAMLESVAGILNGSSNYILTKIFNEGLDYQTALKQAQDLGFAESNPSFDVDGFDSLFKICIITLHSFGVILNPDEVFNYGISKVNERDIEFAKQRGYRIKLVGQVSKVSTEEFTTFVMPGLITKDKYIYNVDDEFNGVVLKGKYYHKQFMFGKGAGGGPTASAVISDITALNHSYKYEYKKQKYYTGFKYTDNTSLKIYLRYTKKEDLDKFKFSCLDEKFYSNDYNYVIGDILLKDLIPLKEQLREMDIFIAYLSSSINSKTF
jgi:homoserine dehydrogenase